MLIRMEGAVCYNEEAKKMHVKKKRRISDAFEKQMSLTKLYIKSTLEVVYYIALSLHFCVVKKKKSILLLGM